MIKVEESLLSNQGVVNVYSQENEDDDYEWAECKIFEDGKVIFEVSHCNSAPEDNNLWRNFSDCYNVICLLEKFYKYGLEGKQVTFRMKDTE